MVARREALATKAWLAANPPKIVGVSQDTAGSTCFGRHRRSRPAHAACATVSSTG